MTVTGAGRKTGTRTDPNRNCTLLPCACGRGDRPASAKATAGLAEALRAKAEAERDEPPRAGVGPREH